MPYEEVKDAFRPESLLPLKISESQARDLIRAWYGRSGSRRTLFEAKALTDTVKGVYLPVLDLRRQGRRALDAPRRATTTTCATAASTVRQVRWTPASGALSHVFDDELVCASTGRATRACCGAVEPFPTDDARAVRSRLSRGLDGRALSDRSGRGGASDRGSRWTRSSRELCAQQVPGDTHRNLVVDATFSDQTFKHILAPVWLLTYIYARSRTRSSSTA